jgi:hypothetical protein
MFGYSAERRRRSLIAGYRRLSKSCSRQWTRTAHTSLRWRSSIPEFIRGYGPVKDLTAAAKGARPTAVALAESKPRRQGDDPDSRRGIIRPAGGRKRSE